MDVNKKWLSIPKDIRKKLLKNVFCVNCLGAVEITSYIIEEHEMGIVLKGKCKNCGHDVARVVEDV
ncbi:MAG: hypothetical protein H0Z32_12005 [Bacillaceae bacterium]|nr:hypothetical protein [Bacillaceae bacterium]